MQISVIIVSYNVKEFLYQCLVSLRKALEGIRSEIVVIDNNSVDGTPIVVEENFPDVEVSQEVMNLIGILWGVQCDDYKAEYRKYLEEKYGD